MKGLLPVEEALARVLADACCKQPVVQLSLLDSLGHVLASDMVSPVDVPLNDNSAMDGYALRAQDAGHSLPVSQRIAAGSVGSPLAAGTAARIFTGAELPPGADAVVMQENCEASEGVVNITGEVTSGQNVRPRGQDIRQAETILRAGRVLLPQDLGLLASIGTSDVPVYKPLRVAVMSTGDELIEPGVSSLLPGQIYNSNRYTLCALLRKLNIEVVDGGIVPDDAEATATALSAAAASVDCVITSGGVSVGEEDHVKSQVERLGQLNLWKLAIKPGKPLAYGRIGDTPFFGLPGNPTSVFVTFCVIARPYLRKLQGVTMGEEDLTLNATANFSRTKPGSRQEYLRVRVRREQGQLLATPFDNQSSGVLSSVSHSNALAIIPVGQVIHQGDQVEIVLLDLLVS